MRHRNRGLTLLELLFVILLMGLVTAAAIPAVGQLVQDHHETAARNLLVGSINEARQTSVRLGVPVSLCPTRNGRECSGDAEDWDRGWLVYRQREARGPRDLFEPDQILQRVDQPVPGLRANRQVFTLRTDGRRSTNGSFFFCDDSGASERAVVVNVAGRARTVTQEDPRSNDRC